MINTRRQAPVSTTTLPLLMDAIGDPGATAASVAEVVNHDSGLASRVLGLANSAQFGLSRTVTRVDLAIGLIGTTMVQTLAIANAVVIDRNGTLGDSQRHAVEVAAAARLLAPLVDVRPSDAFAAGLLHDIGELLLLQAKPTEYAELYAGFESHTDQLRTEKAHFGTDHALLGAEHLLEWRVPDVIADAVADHHEPFRDSAPTTLVVAAADELLDPSGERHHTLDLLGIEPDAADGLRARADGETEELLALLA